MMINLFHDKLNMSFLLVCLCSFWNPYISVPKTQQALFLVHFTPTTTAMQACSFSSHEGITAVLDHPLFPTHWITHSCLINTPCTLLSGISPRIPMSSWCREQPFLWFPIKPWKWLCFCLTWSKPWIWGQSSLHTVPCLNENQMFV